VFAVRGTSFGIPSIRVDGNDILAMIRATDEAAKRARSGEGPTLIEAITYRMSLHTTADDPKVYRDEEEVEPWKARCPILRFEIYLKKKGLLTDAEIELIKDTCEQKAIDARDEFYALPPAKAGEIFDHLYEELPQELKNQQKEYLKRLHDKGVDT